MFLLNTRFYFVSETKYHSYRISEDSLLTLWSLKEVQLLDELLNWNFLREKIKTEKLMLRSTQHFMLKKTEELTKIS